ncbi:alpha/beta fold hydrolase [Pseudonocardia sp. GCM10023141]|uniref:alpha/beta hydrolase family protein n=1 Tax=Pseudonocardia sp. GCM10023141 TaxID=3252653 RepID=UPI00361D6942
MIENSRLPRLDHVGDAPRDPSAIVVLLHGGRAHSRESGERKRLTYRRMIPFARTLVHHGAGSGLAVFMLRYRYRGWNAPAADALRDAQAVLADLAARHPGVPVALVGHSMGGRAALAAASASNVVAVCALAPWLDGSDPVAQLAGRTVLIAHGDRERWTDPVESYDYAVRAQRVAGRIARFDVHGAGHFMISRARDWQWLVSRFVLGALGIEPEDPLLTNAFAESDPDRLRTALPATHGTGGTA